MPPPPTAILVDTIASIDQCLADISPITGAQPSKLALDLEGVELCRSGRVSIVQIFADTSNIIWLIDVTTLGRAAFDHKDAYGQSLREVFQNPRTKKVWLIFIRLSSPICTSNWLLTIQLLFDVRNDADALWNIYEIDLANFYDLQLLDVASRCSRQLSTKYVNGLARCIEFYVNPPKSWKEVKEEGLHLFSPLKGGSYTIFEQRPLDARILAYCAQDVALTFQLEAAMKRTIAIKKGKGWDERILLGSANRVAESKSSKFYGPNGRHRAIAPIF